MRLVLVTTVFFLSSLLATIHEPEGVASGAGPIELRVQPSRRSLKVGDALSLSIELRNRGPESLLVPRRIRSSTGFPSDLEIWFEDAKGGALPTAGSAADSFGPPTDDFHGYVLREWILLAPGYSYGTTIDVGFEFGHSIRRPGRYCAKVRYEASAMDTQNHNNPIRASKDQIEKLPFPAWKGELVSNCSWIEVKAAQEANPVRRQPK